MESVKVNISFTLRFNLFSIRKSQIQLTSDFYWFIKCSVLNHSENIPHNPDILPYNLNNLNNFLELFLYFVYTHFSKLPRSLFINFNCTSIFLKFQIYLSCNPTLCSTIEFF